MIPGFNVEIKAQMDPPDPAWAHCDSVRSLRNTMTCRYCHTKISGGGITGFKYHLAGLQGEGSACKSVPERVKAQMARLIKRGPGSALGSRGKEKKRKKRGSLTVPVLKGHVNSKNVKKDKVSAKKSKDIEYLPPQSGDACSSQRSVHTRSRRGKKVDTSMFESLLETLWREVPEEKRRHFIYCDSLWFCSYQDELKSKDELRKNKILKWINNKRVFSKKYVFVPIVSWGHWSLLILCHFGDMTQSPCMLLLDSLLDAGPKRLENDIRRFVSDIYKISGREKDRSYISEIPFLIPKVPQQCDGEECGTFVLYFMLRFVESCPDTISLDGYPYFLTEEWFTWEEFEKFASELETSLLETKQKGKEHQQSSGSVDPPSDMHTCELAKNSFDSMESQVSSVRNINSAEPQAPQTETRHYIKRRKKASNTEKFSATKGREKMKDNERQNESTRGEISSGTSDKPPQHIRNRNKETDCADTTCGEKQGDAVIGREKMVNPTKQNSSSSVECLTESQDTSQRLVSAFEKHQQLLSQNPEPDPNISPLLKNSPFWQHIQSLDVFKQIPQQPHFLTLEGYCQEVREGMAIGLMVTYANVATSIDKLSFDDDVAIFKDKISCLDTLEENGFNVEQFRSRMKKLLQIKTDHYGNYLRKAELEAQLVQKESANASVLLELDRVGLELTELRKKINFLTEDRGRLAMEWDRLSNLMTGFESENSELRDQVGEERRLYESARANFERLLAEPL